MKKMKEITVGEYCNFFIPQAGLVLIEKDKGSEETRGIYLTKNTRDKMVKWAPTGVIKSISSVPGETEHDKFLQTLYKEGDRVAFNATSPIDAPIPPYTRFKDREVALILLHVADILGYIEEDLEKNKEIRQRGI